MYKHTYVNIYVYMCIYIYFNNNNFFPCKQGAGQESLVKKLFKRK